jgi:hypothetical protein
LFFALFLRGFFAALELPYARKGIGLFFSARAGSHRREAVEFDEMG